MWIIGSPPGLHWTGSWWSTFQPGQGVYGNAISGRSATDAVIVGQDFSMDQAIVFRWNGSQWASEQPALAYGLSGVWEASTGEAWATGEGGTILHHGP